MGQVLLNRIPGIQRNGISTKLLNRNGMFQPGRYLVGDPDAP
ncbi:MAG TPA: hypothetical protein VMC42_03960 [Methanoregulaceae archaeon]|nr:hypothetical protein [Methanoregulaceae archaeon]